MAKPPLTVNLLPGLEMPMPILPELTAVIKARVGDSILKVPEVVFNDGPAAAIIMLPLASTTGISLTLAPTLVAPTP